MGELTEWLADQRLNLTPCLREPLTERRSLTGGCWVLRAVAWLTGWWS